MATTTSSVVLESFTTNKSGTGGADLDGNGFTLTKPTGLEVGDLMVACIFSGDDNGTASAFLTGWTQEENTVSNFSESIMTTLSKVATSSDVSATDFTFNFSGAGSTNVDVVQGALLRLSSHNGLATSSADTGGGAGLTFSGLTPSYVDSYLIFFAAAWDNTATSNLSSYSIVTSNPTWTEQSEETLSNSGNGNTYGTFAFATAERSEKTATGDVSFTASTGSDVTHGSLVAISPIINGTVTDSGQDIEIRTFPIINMEEIELTQDTPIVGGRSITNWTNQNKNSTTWTNQNKS